MERLFGAVWGPPGEVEPAGVFPPLDVTRDAGHFYVRAELPGVSADELRISVDKNKLSLAGSRSAPQAEGVSYHRRERAAGEFDRTIALPAEVDVEAVQAHYEDGVLAITLPLSDSAKGRRIQVQTT